jgi:hypothetical protein
LTPPRAACAAWGSPRSASSVFTRVALGCGYAVLAVSNRAECWSLDAGEGEEGSELAVVESIIRWWTTEEFPHIGGLPLVGIGVSSACFR